MLIDMVIIFSVQICALSMYLAVFGVRCHRTTNVQQNKTRIEPFLKYNLQNFILH